MDKERIKILMKEFDSAMDQTLQALFPGAMLTPKEKNKAQKAIQQYTKGLRAEAIKALQGTPDEKFQEEVDRASSIRTEIRRVLMEAAKALPKGKGGRPKRLNLAARQRAVAEIAAHLQTGATLSSAITMTADHYKVKPRYMQNVWEQRRDLSIAESTERKKGQQDHQG